MTLADTVHYALLHQPDGLTITALRDALGEPADAIADALAQLAAAGLAERARGYGLHTWHATNPRPPGYQPAKPQRTRPTRGSRQ